MSDPTQQHPKAGVHSRSNSDDTLEVMRSALDAIDEQFRALLLVRFKHCCKIASVKRGLGLKLIQPDRVLKVHEMAIRFAAENGIDPDFMTDLYSLIIQEAHRLEGHVFARSTSLNDHVPENPSHAAVPSAIQLSRE